METRINRATFQWFITALKIKISMILKEAKKKRAIRVKHVRYICNSLLSPSVQFRRVTEWHSSYIRREIHRENIT